MICILTHRSTLSVQLKRALASHGLTYHVVELTSQTDVQKSIKRLYDPGVVAAVVDGSIPNFSDFAWQDLLGSLGRRLPVIVLGDQKKRHQSVTSDHHLDALTWLEKATAQEIIETLDACGAISVDERKLSRTSIPIFNAQVPLHMLQNDGALSVLVIDASSLRKIAIDFGLEAYQRMQECLSHLLFELWGAQGSFRSSDLLCRRSMRSNTYYILLEQSRTDSAVPAPGVLERLADRLMIKLQNRFWHEIYIERAKRMIPHYITVVPEIAVGHATVVRNPCVESLELVEQVLENGMERSKIQLRRIRDRWRELMQNLVHTPGLLRPYYQAVFRLDKLSRDLVDKVHEQRSIKPLEHLLYGFESLIRVRSHALQEIYDPSGMVYMDPKYLRPDVLFSLAHAAKLSLELDQACLLQAVQHSSSLPGKLMVNILPRNLYNIDKLQHLIMDRKDIMFEVSETESISNFDVMMKVRARLKEKHMGIATDDFGKGYSGLEQIVKIKPDLIKLDRSLIQDIHKDKPKQVFLKGLVRAAMIGDSTILAEGVELWEEAEVLQGMDINLIQGFLLHRPQPMEAIVKDLDLDGVVIGSVA